MNADSTESGQTNGENSEASASVGLAHVYSRPYQADDELVPSPGDRMSSLPQTIRAMDEDLETPPKPKRRKRNKSFRGIQATAVRLKGLKFKKTINKGEEDQMSVSCMSGESFSHVEDEEGFRIGVETLVSAFDHAGIPRQPDSISDELPVKRKRGRPSKTRQPTAELYCAPLIESLRSSGHAVLPLAAVETIKLEYDRDYSMARFTQHNEESVGIGRIKHDIDSIRSQFNIPSMLPQKREAKTLKDYYGRKKQKLSRLQRGEDKEKSDAILEVERLRDSIIQENLRKKAEIAKNELQDLMDVESENQESVHKSEGSLADFIEEDVIVEELDETELDRIAATTVATKDTILTIINQEAEEESKHYYTNLASTIQVNEDEPTIEIGEENKDEEDDIDDEELEEDNDSTKSMEGNEIEVTELGFEESLAESGCSKNLSYQTNLFQFMQPSEVKTLKDIEIVDELVSISSDEMSPTSSECRTFERELKADKKKQAIALRKQRIERRQTEMEESEYNKIHNWNKRTNKLYRDLMRKSKDDPKPNDIKDYTDITKQMTPSLDTIKSIQDDLFSKGLIKEKIPIVYPPVYEPPVLYEADIADLRQERSNPEPVEIQDEPVEVQDEEVHVDEEVPVVEEEHTTSQVLPEYTSNPLTIIDDEDTRNIDHEFEEKVANMRKLLHQLEDYKKHTKSSIIKLTSDLLPKYKELYTQFHQIPLYIETDMPPEYKKIESDIFAYKELLIKWLENLKHYNKIRKETLDDFIYLARTLKVYDDEEVLQRIRSTQNLHSECNDFICQVCEHIGIDFESITDTRLSEEFAAHIEKYLLDPEDHVTALVKSISSCKRDSGEIRTLAYIDEPNNPNSRGKNFGITVKGIRTHIICVLHMILCCFKGDNSVKFAFIVEELGKDNIPHYHIITTFDRFITIDNFRIRLNPIVQYLSSRPFAHDTSVSASESWCLKYTKIAFLKELPQIYDKIRHYPGKLMLQSFRIRDFEKFWRYLCKDIPEGQNAVAGARLNCLNLVPEAEIDTKTYMQFASYCQTEHVLSNKLSVLLADIQRGTLTESDTKIDFSKMTLTELDNFLADLAFEENELSTYIFNKQLEKMIANASCKLPIVYMAFLEYWATKGKLPSYFLKLDGFDRSLKVAINKFKPEDWKYYSSLMPIPHFERADVGAIVSQFSERLKDYRTNAKQAREYERGLMISAWLDIAQQICDRKIACFKNRHLYLFGGGDNGKSSFIKFLHKHFYCCDLRVTTNYVLSDIAVSRPYEIVIVDEFDISKHMQMSSTLTFSDFNMVMGQFSSAEDADKIRDDDSTWIKMNVKGGHAGLYPYAIWVFCSNSRLYDPKEIHFDEKTGRPMLGSKMMYNNDPANYSAFYNRFCAKVYIEDRLEFIPQELQVRDPGTDIKKQFTSQSAFEYLRDRYNIDGNPNEFGGKHNRANKPRQPEDDDRFGYD